MTLTVLALQRYMMVTRSATGREILTENAALSRDKQFPLSTFASTFITLVFIWVYSALVSFPPLTGFGTFGLNSLGVRWVWVWVWVYQSIDSVNSFKSIHLSHGMAMIPWNMINIINNIINNIRK